MNSSNVDFCLAALQKINQNGGPKLSDYQQIDNMLYDLQSKLDQRVIKRKDLKAIHHLINRDIHNSFQGISLRKPFGYAGDFLTIDRIYTYYRSPREIEKKWDSYFHIHAAPKAVRNRKAYFKTLITEKINHGTPFTLLNIASGPCRDLAEMYSENPMAVEHVKTHCVEMDGRAIQYAEKLTETFKDQITYIKANIFKFETSRRYQLIWSAGLFDYFDNNGFKTILAKLKKWMASQGEIVIGNFNSQHNPSRPYMEIFGDWFLHHRSQIDLFRLAKDVGFKAHQISVEKEQEKVNLFLRLRNG